MLCKSRARGEQGWTKRQFTSSKYRETMNRRRYIRTYHRLVELLAILQQLLYSVLHNCELSLIVIELRISGFYAKDMTFIVAMANDKCECSRSLLDIPTFVVIRCGVLVLVSTPLCEYVAQELLPLYGLCKTLHRGRGRRKLGLEIYRSSC